VGSDGIVVADCDEVRAATDAVEMNLDPGFSPDAAYTALCPSGQVQGAVTFLDDMESGLDTNWATFTPTGAANPWFPSNRFVTSGTGSLWNRTAGAASLEILFNPIPITLPSNAYLHFRHSFDFEANDLEYYDGGIIAYLINGNWFDLFPFFDDGQNYVGTINSERGSPLGGNLTFAGKSHGYVSSRYDLSSLEGQELILGYFVGSDSSTQSPWGWVIDDVMIYQCTYTPNSPDPSHGATSVPFTQTLSWSDPDTDGDAVTYDVWLEASEVPGTPEVLVCDDVSSTNCNPTGDFAYNTRYYWKVEATDDRGVVRTGPNWYFTTSGNPGTIIVDKVTDPVGSPQLFDFTLTGTNVDQNIQLAHGTTPYNSGDLLPSSENGNYSIAEGSLPTGWSQTSATCLGAAARVVPAGAINLQPGETVTCVFTNTLIDDIVFEDGFE